MATSGDIDATRLKGGAVNVETTSGDLQLELDEENDVRAKGTSSDIEVKAPAGDYKVHTETRSGDVENGLGNDPNGSHSIDASTVSGDVNCSDATAPGLGGPRGYRLGARVVHRDTALSMDTPWLAGVASTVG